ncbi:riboflavin synthase subunit alpha [Ferrimonas gelatinilytica]|uniref:Riboflavin synthase n=1 Tax=Ferrimonas gelatinilytica TaxID=1255257 RepID=A0ABP9RWD1_9GAMM
MFTGIVQCTAPVVSLTDHDGVRTFAVSLSPKLREGLQIGASVANNGVCLTVTKLVNDKVFFDVVRESLEKTNLGALCLGSRVNIERSLVFGQEIGGHLVSGHVVSCAQLMAIERGEGQVRMRLSLPSQWMKYVLHKGFIAVNGCSLTVGERFDDGFSLYLIPETLAITNLSDSQVGDRLNIEIDSQTQTIVDTVERVMAARQDQ